MAIIIINNFKRRIYMKIFLICSKTCYEKIKPIAAELTAMGHEISYPNCFNNPNEENENRGSVEQHSEWKRNMFVHSSELINKNDAVLVLNLPVDNRPKNYIGGATFLEMYEAFRNNKPIFVYNELPDCQYKDELEGLTTKVILGDLKLIK